MLGLLRTVATPTKKAKFALLVFVSLLLGWLGGKRLAREGTTLLLVPLALVAGALLGYLAEEVRQTLPADLDSKFTSIGVFVTTTLLTSVLSFDQIPGTVFLGAIGFLWIRYRVELDYTAGEDSRANSNDFTVDR